MDKDISIEQIAEEYKGEWVALWVTEWFEKGKETFPVRAVVIAHDTDPYRLRETATISGATKKIAVNIFYADRLLPMFKRWLLPVIKAERE